MACRTSGPTTSPKCFQGSAKIRGNPLLNDLFIPRLISISGLPRDRSPKSGDTVARDFRGGLRRVRWALVPVYPGQTPSATSSSSRCLRFVRKNRRQSEGWILSICFLVLLGWCGGCGGRSPVGVGSGDSASGRQAASGRTAIRLPSDADLGAPESREIDKCEKNEVPSGESLGGEPPGHLTEQASEGGRVALPEELARSAGWQKEGTIWRRNTGDCPEWPRYALPLVEMLEVPEIAPGIAEPASVVPPEP